MTLVGMLWRPVPGVALCAAVSALAIGLQQLQTRLLGHAWLDGIVLAILIGVAVRSVWEPGRTYHKGLKVCGKTLLELAVVVLGAGLSMATILAVGVQMMLGILAVVLLSMAGGYALCRIMGLSSQMAVLVACGNAICGNSAIAAAAVVVDADEEDVATSIAFTAVLGVLAVIALPLMMPLLGLDAAKYGIFAGMTVYSVSQILAATAPVAMVSVQTGTLVKLVRVMMLGPLLLGISVVFRGGRKGGQVKLRHVLPWFIIGFMLMVAARTEGWLSDDVVAHLNVLAGILTVLAMAALGLAVDIRKVAKAGPRVVSAAVLCLILLGGLSYVLVRMQG